MSTYATRDEAIEREIVEPILAGAVESIEEYDVPAIAAEVLGDYGQGYACLVTAEEFWAIVERHARPTVTVTVDVVTGRIRVEGMDEWPDGDPRWTVVQWGIGGVWNGDTIEPWGEERADRRAGIVASVIANVNDAPTLSISGTATQVSPFSAPIST